MWVGKGSALPIISKQKVEKLCNRYRPSRSISPEDHGCLVVSTPGKGARVLALLQVLGNHLLSSHLVAKMPRAKTTVANTPIMAA